MRQQQLAQREAAGENVWEVAITETAAARITASWFAFVETDPNWKILVNHAFAIVLQATGVDLSRYVGGGNHRAFFLNAIRLYPHGPSVIEAFLLTLPDYGYDPTPFVETLNTILAQERVAFELIDGQMIDFESKELHDAVVAPTLRLLSGRVGWEPVETAYQESLREIGKNPPNAITDAGTALQEALKAAGAEGHSIGPLCKSASKKGLLGPHDSPLTEGIAKIIDWVASDRSQKGDAHNAAPAEREDAWFAVHVVGALILRLAEGTPR